MNSHLLYASALAALGFWLQLSLGCLAVLMIHALTGGTWGDIASSHLQKEVRTLPWLLGLFLVLSFFASSGFFALRGLIYFSIWLAVARGFLKRKQSGRPTQIWSGVSLILLLFSVSFASMDWFMTIDPHWGSTGFGVIFVAGCLLAAFSFAHLCAIETGQDQLIGAPKTPLAIDFGNLVLMASLFWAYVDFMQYLVIWSGQLPTEIEWYEARSRGGWGAAFIGMALLGFAFPVLGTLFRRVKMNPWLMRLILFGVLISRALQCLIWVAPATSSGFGISLLTGLAAIGIFGSPRFYLNQRMNAKGQQARI